MGRYGAIQELRTRLEAIRVSGGYRTNAGQLVVFGERPTLGEDDASEAIAVSVAEDEPGHQAENVVTTIPVVLDAMARVAPAAAGQAIEDLIADVRAAVEQDHDLGGETIRRGVERGPTKPLEREAGGEVVGATIIYRLIVAEKWGTS